MAEIDLRPPAIRQGPSQALTGHRMAAEGPGGQSHSPHLPESILDHELRNLIRAAEGLGPRRRGRRGQARAGRASQLGSASRGPRRPAGRRAQGGGKCPRTMPNGFSLPGRPIRSRCMPHRPGSTPRHSPTTPSSPMIARPGHRYNAACAAALAASGQGKDDPPPDDAAKAKLRQQARDWLKAELVGVGQGPRHRHRPR